MWTSVDRTTKVGQLYILSTRLDNLLSITESIWYLDVHPVLPETSPPELQNNFNALLAPFLLNSALVAIHAMIAIANATRVLNKLELNNVDKGVSCQQS